MAELAFTFLVAIYLAVGAFLLLSTSFIRIAMGFTVFSNGVNLLIFVSGRFASTVPAILPAEAVVGAEYSNPLPQALILTAVVIGFALFTLVLTLVCGLFAESSTDETSRLPRLGGDDACMPPMTY